MKTPGIHHPHDNITTILSNILIMIMMIVTIIHIISIAIFFMNNIVLILLFIKRYPDYFGNVDAKGLAAGDSPGAYPNFFGERVDSPIIGPKTS